MLFDDGFCGGDPVHNRHLHIEDAQVWLEFLHKSNCFFTIGGFSNNVIACFGEDFDNIKSDQGFISATSTLRDDINGSALMFGSIVEQVLENLGYTR